MILSKKEILEAMNPVSGNPTVVIDPFNPDRLDSNSYDVSLGPWFYRTKSPKVGSRLYNPYHQDGVGWGKEQQAMRAEIVFREHEMDVPNGIDFNDNVIIVEPLETILCHTLEYIGGLRRVCGWMQGKSGWSRSHISVCKDAGLGGIGFVSRWTMELTNFHSHLAVPLIVGEPIAKIAFLLSGEDVGPEGSYAGSYQKGLSLEEVKRNWRPEDMLPKLHRKRVVNVTAQNLGK